jgi:aryl-alcohol dehydrogenase-like predicted oxidoreductase
VSALSLGSWRTFEQLPAETGVAILRAAREEGINFFDDARYDDETGMAPIRTGYSEVLFGELFRGAGVRREAGGSRVAPAVAAAEELAGLAGRLDTTAAALALAFPLTNPAVTSVLFGATSAEQVKANCAAVSLLEGLGPADLAHLRRIGQPDAS